MRNRHSLLQPLAAAALCVLTASSSSAQAITASVYSRTGARAVIAPTEPASRVIAIYLFDAPRASGMPVQVTLSDSAGRYSASYKLRGSDVEHAMAFEIRESDMVLTGTTPAGPLTLAVRQKDEFETPSDVIGRWSLGRQSGELLRASR
ncbi:MAG: hypothetical protein JWM95_397 [Gemmatimonadetes bacterium]|nr:hypothetical protein [Gemmatimonadota bacterium]